MAANLQTVALIFQNDAIDTEEPAVQSLAFVLEMLAAPKT
jgi:hypothetical protein